MGVELPRFRKPEVKGSSPFAGSIKINKLKQPLKPLFLFGYSLGYSFSPELEPKRAAGNAAEMALKLNEIY